MTPELMLDMRRLITAWWTNGGAADRKTTEGVRRLMTWLDAQEREPVVPLELDVEELEAWAW